MIKHRLLLVLFTVLTLLAAKAQDSPAIKEAEYTKMITERAAKIVAQLGIDDSVTYNRVWQLVTNQYRDLNTIYTDRDNQIKALKASNGTDKAAIEMGQKSIDSILSAKKEKLHGQYLAKLAESLTPKQIEGVKDGMTYGVLPLTYRSYQEMIPTLTEPQKTQILVWLTEAREHAMDAGSSNEKHGWFGKYKGKINNYLSAQGYDAKKEREEWEKRIEAAKKHNQ